MSEYRCVITVNADADDVFGYVSDPINMPQYLPTVRSAELQTARRVHIVGATPQGPYDVVGDIRVDEDSRRMEWGSGSGNRYHGWLQVAGDERSCQVTVRLVFDAKSKDPKITQTEFDERINEGLRHSVRCIKAICEGVPVPNGGIAYTG